MSKPFTIMRNLGIGLLLSASVAMLALSLPASGWKALSVQTGSMKPGIMPGDLVLVRNVPASDLRIGDIITYISPQKNSQTITHRITEVLTSPNGPGRFIVKGDANAAADPVVYQNQIIGTAKMTIPKLGFLFDWLRTWVGLAIIIYTPALLIVAAEVRKLASYYRSLEPYRATGFNGNTTQPKVSQMSQTRHKLKATSLAAIAMVGVAVPTAHGALLMSTTSRLDDNSISSQPSPTLDHLIISRVMFGGSNNNTDSSTNISVTTNNPQSATTGNATASGSGNASSGNANNTSSTAISTVIANGGGTDTPTSTPTVTLYNPSEVAVNLSGWTLRDNTSTHSFGPGSIITAKASLSFTWPQASGLSRSGDRMSLHNSSAVPVDSLSWGNDVTQMNPAITIGNSSSLLTRKSLTIDTDKATDWQST